MSEQTMSGYEKSIENFKKMKDVEYSKKHEEVAKNLYSFKKEYYKMIETPIVYDDGSPHEQIYICIQTKEMYINGTMAVIRDFVKGEKWPNNKVSILNNRMGHVSVAVIRDFVKGEKWPNNKVSILNNRMGHVSVAFAYSEEAVYDIDPNKNYYIYDVSM